MGPDTLIEYILMLLSNFKADTNLFSSYQMMVRSFKAWEAHTGHAAQGLDWHHRLRSLLSVPLWHLPWSGFFSRFVSSSWHYGISNIHGGRSWSLSAVVNPLRMLCPVLELSHTAPFLSSWAVCETGRVRGGGRNGLGCSAGNDIGWYRYTKISLFGRQGIYLSIGLKFDPQELVMRLVC